MEKTSNKKNDKKVKNPNVKVSVKDDVVPEQVAMVNDESEKPETDNAAETLLKTVVKEVETEVSEAKDAVKEIEDKIEKSQSILNSELSKLDVSTPEGNAKAQNLIEKEIKKVEEALKDAVKAENSMKTAIWNGSGFFY